MQLRLFVKWFAVILLSCCYGLTFTAAANDVQQRFGRMLHLSDVFSLSQHATTAVQDHDGFYWLGTQHGLYRFDGAELKNFRAIPEQADSLSADWITALLVDKQGNIWVGTRYAGLNRFNPDTERFERIKAAGALDASRLNIAKIYQDGNGTIWVSAYGEGLLVWSAAQPELQAFPLPATVDGIDTAFITDILLSEQQTLWLTVGDGPLRSKGQALGGLIKWQLTEQKGQGWHQGNSNFAVDSVTTLLALGHDILLGTFNSGIWVLAADATEPVPFAQPLALTSAHITAMLLDHAAELWVSTSGEGLWHRPTASSSWQVFLANPEVPFSIRSNALHHIYLDQQNTLWLVTPSGFSIFGELARKVYSLPAGSSSRLLSNANVLGISVQAKDAVWLANREAGVVVYNQLTGQLRRFPLPELPDGPTLARAIYAEDAAVWVGTDRGLYLLDPSNGEWRLSTVLPEPLRKTSVGVILADKYNRLWLGTRGSGLLLLDSQRQLKQHFAPHTDIALPFSSISTLLFDSNQNLWVGSPDSGLWRYHEQSGDITYWLQSASSTHGLLFNGIQMLFEENDDIWIRAGNINHRWIKQQLAEAPEFAVYQPLQADEKLAAASWFRLLYRQLWLPKLQTMIELGTMQGMQEATWIGAWAAYDGWLYRGGSQGLDMFRPADLPNNIASPNVKLTSFALFNQRVSPGGTLLPQALNRLSQLSLEYAEDVFSLRFAVPDLLLSSQLEYRYRLQGFDRDWLQVTNQERLATYTRIPPGDYVFEVAARVRHGDWQPASVLNIKILPPWWMTWWFRSLVIALAIFAIWGWLQLKTRAERQMRLQLQQQVAERTQELKENHDALAASNKDLMLLQQIGREITGSLDLGQVLARCHQMLSEIIDVHVMIIGLHRPLTNEIEFVFWLEDQQVESSFTIAANEGKTPASLCFMRREEIVVNQHAEFARYFTELPQPLCGKPVESVVYIPLMLNQQVVGVFSVQSPQTFAYSRSQLNLLRTLSSSIAIAVVNADTFTRLQQTQQQLVIQEKMASLGGLVAGVAHEINTPLGICVTATSFLKAEFVQVKQAFDEKTLQQSQFSKFLQQLADALKILEVNTERAATLVQSFKKVSVDQSANEAREIELAGYLQDVLLSLKPQLKTINCQFQLSCPEGIYWFTDAGALAQIITNLVMNSVKHAFSEQPEPLISLNVNLQGRQLQFDYMDNGCGMSPETLGMLFEPFYTTKRSAGGTGLGAHIVFNLITARLKGQISVRSEPGEGLHYRITLPLDAC